MLIAIIIIGDLQSGNFLQFSGLMINKGNNKITELRTIFQRESQIS
jgi:hypothetical protein